MLSQFPHFGKLEVQDQIEIEKFVCAYEPYSDFNFLSLWSYDTDATIEVAKLYNNLIIKFTDYITKKPFYSFIGNNQIEATVNELLLFSKEKGIESKLKHIPEFIIHKGELSEKFEIAEDEDDYDYILSTEALVTLRGDDYRAKRNFVNRFERFYKSDIRLLDLHSEQVKDQIEQLFLLWEKQKEFSRDRTEIEFTAIKRFLHLPYNPNILGIGIYVDGNLVGFTLNEMLDGNYAVIHFEKANVDFVGVYSYVKHITAKILLDKGYKYINYEQDLGIEGLRKSKKAWHPVKYLKKYTIAQK